VRLGLFPGGVDARDVTQPDTVEYFRLLDWPRGERFVLALEGPKSDRVRAGTLLDGFDILGLLPGFPNRVYAGNEGAGKVKQDSSRTATIASEVSVGMRAEVREVNCAEFQLPRQIR